MRLHHFAHSSASYRVRIALAIKGIAVNYVTVDMTKGEQATEAYAMHNPQRMVPCLELPDGRVLGQSLAIIDYLERLQPEPSVYPADPVARAEALGIALLIACEISPLQAKIVQRRLTGVYSLTDAQVQDWLAHWIRRGLAPVEADLARRWRGGFAFGPTPSIADICIVPQLRNAHRFGVDVSDFPTLAAHTAHCLTHPAFQAAHPDRWAA